MPAVIGRCVLALGLLLGAASPAAAQGERVIERPDFEHYFAEAGTRGTIVVHDLAKDVRFVVNPTRAATGYLPASTFKILNALAGLSAGAVRDPDGEAFISDGDAFQVDGKPLLPPQCTGELTLRAAFRYSCIPVFQEVARRVGLPRFRYLLAQIGYGNGDITSAPVDSFWLEGGLRVTAYQQVRLLEQLLGDDLPFTRDAMIQVKDMMVVEDKGGTVIQHPAEARLVGRLGRSGRTLLGVRPEPGRGRPRPPQGAASGCQVDPARAWSASLITAAPARRVSPAGWMAAAARWTAG